MVMIQVFGLMPDWNPAGMIGYQPNMLSYSIYKEIITWVCRTMEFSSVAKRSYKYVNKPLIVSSFFQEKPFIDYQIKLLILNSHKM